jgi:putative membrane protein
MPAPFIDYVSLLLLNMVAGYFLLSAYVLKGLDDPLDRRWAPGFAMIGLLAFVFGAAMVVTWPLPGPYNSIFGEMSVLFGLIFLGAALSIANGWSLVIVATYAFFAGLAAIVLGARIISLRLTLLPWLSGVGFILSGLGGVFAAPTLVWMRRNVPFRALAALILLAAAVIWAATVYPECWTHPKFFAPWVPLASRVPVPH